MALVGIPLFHLVLCNSLKEMDPGMDDETIKIPLACLRCLGFV